ncbi:MAG: 30S ribosomal protein S12 methylthiotransferase RimO [Candidatus Zixiibacteriota bacterium]
MKKTIWIETLGCPKNEVDSERITSLLLSKGYRISDDQNQADVLILNTCGFIQSAKEESIEEIFNLIAVKEKDQRIKLIVCGCLAQRYPEELWKGIPEIDGLFGLGEMNQVGTVCSSVLRGERICRVNRAIREDNGRKIVRLTQSRPYAYLKIADGCDNRCSYCAIPSIRGKFRSKRMEEILEEAVQLVRRGVKEINLVAQDTTLYGVDLYGEKKLPQLLLKMSRIPKLKWIRLLYTHPAHFSDELIEQIASNPKVCKYVDLPLQHISDEILTKMRRKVKRREIERLISKLREKIPRLTLRTSFIVGFPGEKVKHFEELLDFVEGVKFDKLGAFTYSKEEGTKAYEYKGQVPAKLKQERLDQLMLSQQRIVLEKNQSKIGKAFSVLIEAESDEGDGGLTGRSQGEAPEVDGVILVKGECDRIGKFVKTRIVDYRDYDLIGTEI